MKFYFLTDENNQKRKKNPKWKSVAKRTMSNNGQSELKFIKQKRMEADENER